MPRRGVYSLDISFGESDRHPVGIDRGREIAQLDRDLAALDVDLPNANRIGCRIARGGFGLIHSSSTSCGGTCVRNTSVGTSR